MLQILLGVAIFILSAPSGMAKEAIREGARAEIFVPADELREPDRQDVWGQMDFALLPCAEGEVESEETVEEEREGKRLKRRASAKSKRQVRVQKRGSERFQRPSSPVKRPSPSKFFVNKCRFSISLSPEVQAKGVARHLPTQDARQERSAAIRFLQLQALIDC